MNQMTDIAQELYRDLHAENSAERERFGVEPLSFEEFVKHRKWVEDWEYREKLGQTP